MNITKTLFTEFLSTPKLARFHVNDKETYQKIQDSLYEGMEGSDVGQSFEDYVKKLLGEYKEVESDWNFASYFTNTKKLIEQKANALYQPRFQAGDLAVRCDFLVLNEEWIYDLLEVKTKNSIRKTTKNKALKEELLADVSFQRYVVSQALWNLFSGNCYLVYLNGEYIRQGELDIQQLIQKEEVSWELWSDEIIESHIQTMKTYLPAEKSDFEKAYPYDGKDHLLYFWIEAPKGSIRYIPWISNKKKTLYELGKTDIMELGDEEIKLLHSAKGEENRTSQYVRKYQKSETIIDREWVQLKLSALSYPFFFYDYETISSPIPLFNWTSPRTQLPIQYSIHKVDEDGTITHRAAIIQWKIEDNSAIINQLYKDLEWGKEWTFIVWNKWFENSKNDEMGVMYPEYKEFFKNINEKTFDLMEVFKEGHYFDRRFCGSASIKKVLPVLTEISYDDLEIWNGGIATWILLDIAIGKLLWKALEEQKKNLLAYCEQDTWAMIRIWQELLKAL